MTRPLPNSHWFGDGLSGFGEIIVLESAQTDLVEFFPVSEGWTKLYLTYSLPLSVFHRVYQPCPPASPHEEKSSSKIASLWHRLCFSIARWF